MEPPPWGSVWGSVKQGASAVGGGVAAASHSAAEGAQQSLEKLKRTNWTQVKEEVAGALESGAAKAGAGAAQDTEAVKSGAAEAAAEAAAAKARDEAVQAKDAVGAEVHQLQGVDWKTLGAQVATAVESFNATATKEEVQRELRDQASRYKAQLAHPPPGSVHVEWSCAKKVLGAGAAGAAAGTAATVLLVPLLLDALGFSEGGVVLGSTAACLQSKIGNVEKGSLFALLQSIAMAGLAEAPYVLVGGSAVGGAAGVEFALSKLCSHGEYWPIDSK